MESVDYLLDLIGDEDEGIEPVIILSQQSAESFGVPVLLDDENELILFRNNFGKAALVRYPDSHHYLGENGEI